MKRSVVNSLNISVICRVFLIAIGIVTVSACGNKAEKKDSAREQQQDQDTLLRIDVESIVENVQDVNLSEVASDIEYVPLELKGDKYLRCVGQVELTDSYIFVHDHRKLLQFTRGGKFIKQIGSVGRGPGEYSCVMNFVVREETDLILVQGEYGLHRYNMQGMYQRKEHDPVSCRFMILDDNHLAFYRANSIEQPENIVVTDLELNRLYSFKKSNPQPRRNNGIVFCPFYCFDNKIFIKEHYNDTLYKICAQQFIPHMIFNESNLLMPKDFDIRSDGTVAGLIKQLNKVKDKIMPYYIHERKDKVFIGYMKGLNPREQTRVNILFDKKLNMGKVLQGEAFHNNIDGGIDFWSRNIFKDSLMIHGIEAFKLKAHVASNAFKNSKPKYLEKKKALEKLANSLSENDNPVLMLVRLKE